MKKSVLYETLAFFMSSNKQWEHDYNETSLNFLCGRKHNSNTILMRSIKIIPVLPQVFILTYFLTTGTKLCGRIQLSLVLS